MSSTTGNSINYTTNGYVQQGWQCPICKKILAPFMSHCPFHDEDEEHYKWSTTGTLEVGGENE